MARIILLTAPECVPHLAPLFEAAGAAVDVAITRADLDRAVGTLPARLVSFGSGVIVPAAVLKAVAGAYNFHPGPPSLPGLFPSVHALYERHATFGVTLHEMAAAVDGGPIVAVDTFSIPANANRLQLDTLTFSAMIAMFARTAAALTDLSGPLSPSGDSWTGRYRTRADFAALCELPADTEENEFAHRLRAVGEGPEHALTITRFGRRFRLVSDVSPVVRGGQAL